MTTKSINDRIPQSSSRPRCLRTTRYGAVARIAFGLALAANACSGGDPDQEYDAALEANSAVLDEPASETRAVEAAAEAAEAAFREPAPGALAAEIAEWKLSDMEPSNVDIEIDKNATCGTKGPTGQSVRNDDAPSNGGSNQRSGSSTGCVALGVLQPTDDALYFCFTLANDGATWTYNQNLRTGVLGWTRDDLLDDNGSFTFCGF